MNATQDARVQAALTDREGPADDFRPTYRSGAAARLAGIPVETLRVWERRYRVVGPRLSPRGHRLYSAEDVGRLSLIRQLVELGSPIGAIAGLPVAALREMRSAASTAARGDVQQPLRLALVGGALQEEVARDGALRSTLEIVASCAGPAGAAEALRGLSADLLVIELPTLQSEAVAIVDALVDTVGARHAVVVCRFAPAAVIGALRERGHTVVRAPLDAEEVERVGRSAMAQAMVAAPASSSPPIDAVSRPRFDDASLARLARSSTTLYCECPRHLADLLQGLGAFERYSAECANRSPADAALHRYLQRVAGSARVLLEDALVRVARAEGLALPADAGKAMPAA